MILQSVKCSCCRQHLSSLSNLTVFLEEVCFVYCLRKGSRLEKVPEWCYSGMLSRNVWVKVAVQGCSCTGPALPAWQCLSNKRCKVFGWVFKGPSVIAPCYGQVSSVCGVGDWFVEEQGAELQSSIILVTLAALELLLRVILLSACSCWLWKHKHDVVRAHCIVLIPETFILKYGCWNLLYQ